MLKPEYAASIEVGAVDTDTHALTAMAGMAIAGVIIVMDFSTVQAGISIGA